jgi:hypothetical protein
MWYIMFFSIHTYAHARKAKSPWKTDICSSSLLQIRLRHSAYGVFTNDVQLAMLNVYIRDTANIPDLKNADGSIQFSYGHFLK